MMRCNIADCFYIFISYLNAVNAAQKPTGKPPQALGNNTIFKTLPASDTACIHVHKLAFGVIAHTTGF